MSSVRLEDYGINPINNESIMDMSSYGLRPYDTASEELTNKAKIAGTADKEIKNIQPQEEFSNPTSNPEFESMPEKEKLQRIQLSQFDPANQTATGGFLPPGAYENPVTRMAASLLPTVGMPEFSVGQGLLSRYAINPLINALSRITAGTGSNLAYQSPEIKNTNQLKQALGNDLTLNSILEGGAALFKAPGYFAEMANPLKYGYQKANQIRNEASAINATTNEMYRPVMEKYNNNLMTPTPKKYLSSAGIKRSDLYADAKIIYDKFIEEPNFKNLHELQSKLGKDWARISKSPISEEKSQLFKQQRDTLKDRIENYLSQDKNDLAKYQMASNYARDNLYPYYATPTLKSITKGNLNQNPQQLAKSIQKGIDKTVGAEEKSKIPEGHPLRNHLKELNKFTNFGNLSKAALPTIFAELIHPGLGSVLGGAGAAGALLSPYGNPILGATAQNPLLQNFSRKYINPLYYGAGRAMIGNKNT